MYTALIIALSFAIAGTIGFQLHKYLTQRNWLAGQQTRLASYNYMRGYGYNLGFYDGFLANEDDVDPDEDE